MPSRCVCVCVLVLVLVHVCVRVCVGAWCWMRKEGAQSAYRCTYTSHDKDAHYGVGCSWIRTVVLDAHCGVGYALWCYVCYAAYVTCTLQCNSICMLPENPLHNQTHDTHTITCTLKHFNNLCCHLPRSFLCSFLAITLTPTPPVSGKPGALPTPDFVISSVATLAGLP